MPATVFTSAAKNSEDPPIQRMAAAGDRYFLWQGMVVGSLSRDPLTMSGTTGCWKKWHSGLMTRTSCTF
jgi:hypothetical protein